MDVREELKALITTELNKKFDLHVHSKNSDGVRSPEEVLMEGQNHETEINSITDHDTIKTYDDIRAGRIDVSFYKGKIIPGVEVTSLLHGKMVESLVYFDYDKLAPLREDPTSPFRFLNRTFKLKRNYDIFKERLAKAQNCGLLTPEQADIRNFIKCYEIKDDEPVDTDDETLEFTRYSELGISENMLFKSDGQTLTEAMYFKGKSYVVCYDNFNSQLYHAILSNPQGKGKLDSYEKVDGQIGINNFGEFLRYYTQREDSEIYVQPDGYWPTVGELCSAAKDIDAVVLLAHPFNYKQLNVPAQQLMQEAYEQGVDGFECFYGFATLQQMSEIKNFAESCDREMILTGGSDSHKYHTDPLKTIPWTVGFAPTTQMDITTYNLQNVCELNDTYQAISQG